VDLQKAIFNQESIDFKGLIEPAYEICITNDIRWKPLVSNYKTIILFQSFMSQFDI
jgi:hypothetical protein